jgi:chromosome partitioning protein
MIAAPYRDDSNKIVILNPKGGCGKTTLATNLASYFALRGPAPTLIDTDPRGYTTRWLERRSPSNRRVNGITNDKLALHGRRGWPFRSPRETGAVIIDTPAGLSEREITSLTYNADCILVPVLPSAFDVHVTTSFIAELLLLTDFDRPVAVVANRTRKNTRSLAMLMRVLQSFETPTIAVLSDSQNYVHAADHGLGIYEMPRHKVSRDLEQMDRVVNWVDRQLLAPMEPGQVSRFDGLPKRFTASASGLSRPN